MSSKPAKTAAKSRPPSERRGLMFVLSSPSGAGKTTLSRLLLENDAAIAMSISVTTRPRRSNEIDGRDYFFVDDGKFDRMVAEDAFLEHATVFKNRYGTPRRPVEEALTEGRDVLFDIDWQGAQQLARNAPGDLVRVFILPPSLVELERRLKTRAQDSDKVVAERMAKARDEMSHWSEYDYVLINDDVARCFAEIRAILQTERLRTSRQPRLDAFVSGLTNPP